jgi:ligand-binding SRPBCC domain-containing protein
MTRNGRGYRLVATQRLPMPRDEVFPFFADAGNLEKITPASVRFEIVTPRPIEMGPGAMIDYRLRVHHVPVRWRSEITVWDPPHRFVDEQRRGPYRWWRHEHVFEEEEDGSTLARDHVEYGVPGGPLVHRLFVARSVRQIFRYRSQALRTVFGPA